MMNQPRRRKTSVIMLNTSNYTASSNSYIFKPRGGLNLTGLNATIALGSISFYNSLYNISPDLANNTFQIKWIDDTIHTCTLSSGYYDFTALNQALQLFCLKEKLYLQSNDDANMQLFFVSVDANNVAYTCDVTSLFVPSGGVTGYSIPNGATWTFPQANKFPQLIVGPGLQKLMGFPNQTTFPPTTSGSANIVASSTTFPVLSPTFSCILTCNLVSDSLKANPHCLAQIPLSAAFGNLVHQTFPQPTMLTAIAGQVPYVECRVLNQDEEPVNLVDKEMVISLILEVDE